MKAQVISAFDKVDVNKNGKISNDEMINLLKDLGIEPLYINTLAALIMTFVGGNKEIPRKEFEATFKNINEQGGWTMLDLFFHALFERIDKSKAGTVSIKEVAKFTSNYAKDVPVAQIQEVVTKYDADHNGKIDFNEFTEFIKMIIDLA